MAYSTGDSVVPMDQSDCRIHLNSDDLEDFALTKAEKVHCFGSPVGNDKIRQVIDQHIPKNTQNETIPDFQDLNFNLPCIHCNFNFNRRPPEYNYSALASPQPSIIFWLPSSSLDYNYYL